MSRQNFRRGILALAGACSLAAAAAAAQEQKTFVEAIGSIVPTPLPPGGSPPRMADGRVDLSGVWFSGTAGRTTAWSVLPREPSGEEPVPFQPWAKAKITSMTRTQIQLMSPQVNCLPKGVPGMFTTNPHPSQIITLPGLFVHLIEAGNNWRLVHTDKRPHPEYPDPLFNGNSSAWWDGDTLVIDTIAIDEGTWIENNGWFHSDALRVIERIRRPSMNYLEYQFTIEDPKVLTKPWTSSWRKFSLGKEDLLEYYCTNNENVEYFRKLFELETERKR